MKKAQPQPKIFRLRLKLALLKDVLLFHRSLSQKFFNVWTWSRVNRVDVQ